MAMINPGHLLDQAEYLLKKKNSRGRVRQADRRRAISAAYYAVFHFALTAVADEFVGITERRSACYGLAYRSVDHRTLETLCKIAARESLPAKYHSAAPDGGLGAGIRQFASLLIELKEKRISADYDPTRWIKVTDARSAIEAARSAIARFDDADPERQKAFLTLLIFPPR